MTRDDIIRMAREAHLVMYDYDHPSLERFAELVVAHEQKKFCATLRQIHDAISLASRSGELKIRGTHD